MGMRFLPSKSSLCYSKGCWVLVVPREGGLYVVGVKCSPSRLSPPPRAKSELRLMVTSLQKGECRFSSGCISGALLEGSGPTQMPCSFLGIAWSPLALQPEEDTSSMRR